MTSKDLHRKFTEELPGKLSDAFIWVHNAGSQFTDVAFHFYHVLPYQVRQHHGGFHTHDRRLVS